MSIGEQIRSARKKAGLTQKELAGDRYSASYVSQIESGLINPSLKALNYIAARLNKPIGFFCDEVTEVQRIATRQEAEKRVKFLINLGESYLTIGETAKALDNLAAAEKASAEVESEDLKYLLLRHKAKVKASTHAYDEAEELYLGALDYFKSTGQSVEVAKTYYSLSLVYHMQQIPSKDESCLRKALDALQAAEVEDPTILVDIYNGLGAVAWVTGRLEDAASAYEKALGFAQHSNDLDKLAGIYMNLGANYRDQGDYERAADVSLKAITIFENINNKRRLAEVLSNTGIVLTRQEKYGEALSHFNRSLKVFEELGDSKSGAYVMTEMARLELAQGNLEAAQKQAQKSLAIVEEFEDKVEKAHVLTTLGEIAQRKKDWAVARNYYKESIEILEDAEVAVELTDTLHKYSQMLLQSGETEEAAIHLKKALDNIQRA